MDCQEASKLYRRGMDTLKQSVEGFENRTTNSNDNNIDKIIECLERSANDIGDAFLKNPTIPEYHQRRNVSVLIKVLLNSNMLPEDDEYLKEDLRERMKQFEAKEKEFDKEMKENSNYHVSMPNWLKPEMQISDQLIDTQSREFRVLFPLHHHNNNDNIFNIPKDLWIEMGEEVTLSYHVCNTYLII